MGNAGGQNDQMSQFMAETRSSIRSLETQIGQLATLMANRAKGELPSTTEVNPKEQCKAVTLRSGKEYDGPAVEQEEKSKDQDQQAQVQPQVEEQPEKGKSTEVTEEKRELPSYDHHIRVPFPQRLRKSNLDKQFSKFLEIFKKLHINIPFAEALEQMPSYVKFMKEILSKKRKLGDYEMVALSEECSAVIQKKLPPKLKDPGNFTIPCVIGDLDEMKALCDLGASVNLMPLSVYNRLKLGQAKPTTVTLQMADRSLSHPYGIVEDVLVKVGKFIFPADFIILDMEEDEKIPIIMGRPFLATGRALIDVQKGELMLRVDKEEAVFPVFSPIDIPACYRVEVVSNESSKPGIKQKINSAIKKMGRVFKRRTKKKPSRLHIMEKQERVLVSRKGEFNHATGILKNTKSDLKVS